MDMVRYICDECSHRNHEGDCRMTSEWITLDTDVCERFDNKNVFLRCPETETE